MMARFSNPALEALSEDFQSSKFISFSFFQDQKSNEIDSGLRSLNSEQILLF